MINGVCIYLSIWRLAPPIYSITYMYRPIYMVAGKAGKAQAITGASTPWPIMIPLRPNANQYGQFS